MSAADVGGALVVFAGALSAAVMVAGWISERIAAHGLGHDD